MYWGIIVEKLQSHPPPVYSVIQSKQISTILEDRFWHEVGEMARTSTNKLRVVLEPYMLNAAHVRPSSKNGPKSKKLR